MRPIWRANRSRCSTRARVAKNITGHSSFDLGRGCPFECSFCTIINVQGRKSRFRTPDDLESYRARQRRTRHQQFFLTDDNFARNKHWEILVDRLIALKARGLAIYYACPSRHDGLQDPALHRKALRGRRLPDFHRPGEHQFRQSRGEQEAAEPNRRLSRDDAGLEEISTHHHLRLHHRISQRYRGIRAARRRSAQARSGDRQHLSQLPHAAARQRGSQEALRGRNLDGSGHEQIQSLGSRHPSSRR